jgi:hypothetical protein
MKKIANLCVRSTQPFGLKLHRCFGEGKPEPSDLPAAQEKRTLMLQEQIKQLHAMEHDDLVDSYRKELTLLDDKFSRAFEVRRSLLALRDRNQRSERRAFATQSSAGAIFFGVLFLGLLVATDELDRKLVRVSSSLRYWLGHRAGNPAQ